jgi:predicted RNase H-like nuclease (RuvC/YqgF family)
MTNEELLNEINKLKADLVKLSQKLDNKQGRVAARVSELEDDTKKYKNQIANLDSANDNKKERIAGLERKLDTKQGRMGDRVSSLEEVVDGHADEIAEHSSDEGHTGVPSRSKLFLMKGSINRVNNAWRRLSFDGNYAMEMEDWSFTSRAIAHCFQSTFNAFTK